MDQSVVNGQKVWTSGGVTADWMSALVRMGEPESRPPGLMPHEPGAPGPA